MVDETAGTEETEGSQGRSDAALAGISTREGRGRTREWLGRLRRGWLLRETVAISKIAAPMVVNNFFYQIMFTVALVFVGQRSGRSLELDAVALALSFMNVTGVSVGTGLSTAAETLCAQMYGFKNYKGLGIVTQRGIWIMWLAMFPILIIWFNTESFLLLIQQDACVARLTARYVRIFASALPFLFLYFMLQRYLVAQSIVLLFGVLGLVVNVISAALHGVFVYWIDLGIEGSAIAISLATIISPFIVIIYIRLRNIHHLTWGGWSLDGLRGWGQFFRLGIPGVLMLCFEWWCYEFAAFVTGSISNTQLAIHTVILQILSLNFMVPYGVGMGLTVRVGNELGAGNPQRAKQATYTALAITLVQTVVVAVFLLSTRSLLGHLFSQEKDVIDGVGKVIYVTVPLVFTDSFQGVMQGVLRGTGKQLSGAIINFISFYLIGFPVGTVLAVVARMGALGMWIGLLLPSTLQSIFYFVMTVSLNWEKESVKAINRAKDSQANTSAADGSDGISVTTLEEDESEEVDRKRLISSDFTAVDNGPAGKGEQEEAIQSGTVIEELPLMSVNGENEVCEEEEMATLVPSDGRDDSQTGTRTGFRNGFVRNWRLVLSRVCLVMVAVLLLVLGGLAGRYQPHRPHSEYCLCSDLSGNRTEEWGCGNGTNPNSMLKTSTAFPNPSSALYVESSYLMPTSSPLP